MEETKEVSVVQEILEIIKDNNHQDLAQTL